MTSQLNKIADYWNQRSFGYSLDNQEELLHDQEKWIELINRYLKINKGMKVLDLGCGPGFFSVMLTNLGCQVIGIDYSEKMLEEGQDCSQVLIQLAAVKSALNNTGKIILKDHINHCIVEAVETGDKKALEDLSAAIDQFMK